MRKAQKGVRILKLFYFFLEEEVLINTGCFVNNFILHFYFLWEKKKKYIKCIQKQLGKSLQNSISAGLVFPMQPPFGYKWSSKLWLFSELWQICLAVSFAFVISQLLSWNWRGYRMVWKSIQYVWYHNETSRNQIAGYTLVAIINRALALMVTAYTTNILCSLSPSLSMEVVWCVEFINMNHSYCEKKY